MAMPLIANSTDTTRIKIVSFIDHLLGCGLILGDGLEGRPRFALHVV
jgi:hypothetical protein